MQTVTTFDPSNTLSGDFDTTFGGQATESQLYVWNDSNAGLQFQLTSGKSLFIPPGVGYPIRTRPYPMPRIYWVQDYVLAGAASVSRVTVEIYEPGEPLPSETPVPIIRNVNVGNTVQTGATVANASQVIYDPTAINGETASSVSSMAGSGGAAPLVDVTDANPTGGKRKFVQKTGEFDINGDGSATAPAFHGVADSATNATNVGDGASGSRITVGDTGTNLDVKPTSGAARGLTINTRDGTNALHQIASAAADGTGAVFHGTADHVPATGVTAGALPAGVTIPAAQVTGSIPSTQQIDTTNANSNTPQIKADAVVGLSTQNTTQGGRRYVALMPTEADSAAAGTALGNTDAAGVFHATIGSDNGAGLRLLTTGGVYRPSGLISGSGSATVNHGLGATPSAALVNTANGSNSTTFGSGSYTSTTVFIFQFNAQAWVGIAM